MQVPDNNSALRNLSALVDFTNLINSSLDVNFTLNNLLLTCFGKFHTTKGLIALVEEDGTIIPRMYKGFTPEKISEFPDLNLENYKNNPAFEEFKEKNKIQICTQIISSNGVRGIFMLGERLMKKEYIDDDSKFIKTITNVAATAIENSLVVEKIKNVNKQLDAKVNQLSSLFDLSKEFSGILDREQVNKLLVYSIIGQLLVSKFAVIVNNEENYEILESKFPENKLNAALKSQEFNSISDIQTKESLIENYPKFADLGAELLIPMKIQNKTRGVLILGSRATKQPYQKSDVEYISSLGSLAIISIENARLFEEAIEKQRLEKDLEIARNIQKNLLPDKFPELNNFEIVAFNQSARQVGGDYYDVVRLDDNRTLFAIADVSGKGVQAALLMANLQAFLKSICKQNIALDKASNLINDLVSENTTMGSFITFFWGELNDDTKELTYVNAGHNPPLLIRNNEIIRLTKGGMILGVMETMVPYEFETIKMEKGDTLVTFTDGITEAMDINDNEYSDERIEELAVKNSSMEAKEFLNSVIEDVKSFTKNAQQSDDITCLIVKVK